MEFADPFAAPGQWYKGNLHTHTTESDGGLRPEEAARLYREAGYQFLALTDHVRVTRMEGTAEEGILLLLGAELHGDRSDTGEAVHVLGFGLAEAAPVPSDTSVPESIAWIKERGGEAVIAHPYWSGLVVSDLLRWEGHLGIEVFNSTCHFAVGKGCSAVHWDDLLGRRLRPWGLAVDDSHGGLDNAQAWVMVKAPELTREAILASLRAGLFYSSRGPVIHELTVGDGRVRVRTSPVREINFVAQRWAGRHVSATDESGLTEATYDLRGHEQYLRVECRGADGRWAWSNPIFF